MDASPAWVRSVIQEDDTLVLGAVGADGSLVGTIACRSVVSSGGILLVGTEAVLQKAYRIEGLCVHPEWRGKHLAGWLIAWVDYIMNRDGPNAFFWSREVPTGVHGTDLAIHTYAHLDPTKLQRPIVMSSPNLKRIPWSEMQRLWERSASSWRGRTSIVSDRLFEEDGTRMEAWFDQDTSRVILIADTFRKTRGENRPILEVQWCGWLTIVGTLLSAKDGEDFRHVLEAVALQQRGGQHPILFATDAVCQGGARMGWPLPWKFGTSGFHAIYLYNYMPPKFWDCTVTVVRGEI